ncbi:MAG: peptidase S8 [Gammaproteobacteria bacterium HGW-Gammaproteobacteria-1]|jgi:subtilisin family serine protease|nr:MAG: peptidase S8 [Gammaproteobacteria bacterium HGW-Gammaproteobacteria-1]
MNNKYPVWFLVVLALGFSASAAQKAAPGVSDGAAEYVAGELLVKFKPQSDTAVQGSFMAELNARGHKALSRSRVHKVTLPQGADARSVAELYAADPRIEYAQPNYIYHTMATVPDDIDYGKLWGLKNTGQTLASPVYGSNNPGIAGYDMDAEAAWDLQTDCRGVIVAVVDTGVNYTHEDLIANMWDGGVTYPNHGYDFVDTDNDPVPSDGESHGTHVAGTIAAVGNNATGTTGVCWQAEIMSVRVLGAGGSGTTDDIAQGVDFAVAQGARVINMSLGGGSFDHTFSDAIADARTAGVVVVVAAGNGGADGVGDNNDLTPQYPCSYTHDNIICVAALDQSYALASFSNYGATSVDVGAPGVNVQSSIAGTTTSDNFSVGWTLGGDWAVSGVDYWCGSASSLVNPADYCEELGGYYAPNANDAVYKTFDLGAAGLLGAGVTAYVDYYMDVTDSLSFGVQSTGGDPFAGGTMVRINSDQNNEVVLGAVVAYDLTQSSCLTANCSIGVRLVSDASNHSYGARVYGFEINKSISGADTYALYNGTSMATPHVAGLAAMIWSYNPAYAYDDVVSSVKSSGDAVAALYGKSSSGRAVDAYKALQYIQAPTGVTAVVVP